MARHLSTPHVLHPCHKGSLWFSLVPWKVQSSLYNSAGSCRPYWQPVNSRACRSLKHLEGWHSASLLCPSFHCQTHQGVVVCPTENLHSDIFCLPHPDSALGALLQLINCSHSETLLLMTFSEEPSVKLPVSNCTFSLAKLSSLLCGQSQALRFPLLSSSFSGFFCLLLQPQQVSSGTSVPYPSPFHSDTSWDSSHVHLYA